MKQVCDSDGCDNEAVTDYKDGGFVWLVCRPCAAELYALKRERVHHEARRAMRRGRSLFQR